MLQDLQLASLSERSQSAYPAPSGNSPTTLGITDGGRTFAATQTRNPDEGLPEHPGLAIIPMVVDSHETATGYRPVAVAGALSEPDPWSSRNTSRGRLAATATCTT